MKTLRTAKMGETVKVLRIEGDGATRRRLMDMGLVRGVEVYLRKVAPLGDPIEVTLRGYELSIRKKDAENIVLAEADEAGAVRAPARSAAGN